MPPVLYSLKIDSGWCRLIHNHQQRVCSHCHALEDSRRKCPKVTCNQWGQHGHLSFNCDTQQNDSPNDTEEKQENPDKSNNTSGDADPASRREPNIAPAATGKASDAAENTREEDPNPGDPNMESQRRDNPQDFEMKDQKTTLNDHCNLTQTPRASHNVSVCRGEPKSALLLTLSLLDLEITTNLTCDQAFFLIGLETKGNIKLYLV